MHSSMLVIYFSILLSSSVLSLHLKKQPGNAPDKPDIKQSKPEDNIKLQIFKDAIIRNYQNIKKVQDESNTSEQELLKKIDESTQKVIEENEKKVEEQKKIFEENLKKLKAEQEDKSKARLEDTKKVHESMVEDFKAKMKEEIESIEKKGEEQEKQSEADFEKTLQLLKENHNDELLALEEKLKVETDKLLSDNKEKLSEFIIKNNQTLDNQMNLNAETELKTAETLNISEEEYKDMIKVIHEALRSKLAENSNKDVSIETQSQVEVNSELKLDESNGNTENLVTTIEENNSKESSIVAEVSTSEQVSDESNTLFSKDNLNADSTDSLNLGDAANQEESNDVSNMKVNQTIDLPEGKIDEKTAPADQTVLEEPADQIISEEQVKSTVPAEQVVSELPVDQTVSESPAVQVATEEPVQSVDSVINSNEPSQTSSSTDQIVDSTNESNTNTAEETVVVDGTTVEILENEIKSPENQEAVSSFSLVF